MKLGKNELIVLKCLHYSVGFSAEYKELREKFPQTQSGAVLCSRAVHLLMDDRKLLDYRYIIDIAGRLALHDGYEVFRHTGNITRFVMSKAIPAVFKQYYLTNLGRDTAEQLFKEAD